MANPMDWKSPFSGKPYFGGPSTPGAGGGATGQQPKPPTASSISLEKMLAEAASLAGVENNRFQTEYGRLQGASAKFNEGFEQDEQRLTGLAMGADFDAIGQGALDQSRQMRTQLGGRGIDASSGLATHLADRIGLQQQSLKYGAMRSATADSYQRRNAHRTAQYAQQAGLAQFGNQSPSMILLDSLTNKAEFDLASEVSDKQLEAAKYTAKKGASAAKSAGIGSIIGSVLGSI